MENLLGPQLWQLESNESHKKKVPRQQVRLSRLFETLSDFFKRKKPKPNFVLKLWDIFCDKNNVKLNLYITFLTGLFHMMDFVNL